ncbi:multicomponent Na+:H+ antiporter subunit F [Sinorhizobium kostiense]|uniref:Multicomponent Na+:H+ antiporter subunit F n=1 Tax=Sinorhizobium kostiense TaxID=76747 RepID=A0ABS4QWY9_9HYPH|nr:cation:proton antiporter [Sinorhizobium kostiense]MBP2235164.1 multicomponent Na+:H+ antiporter subunit F [Sinorhizobium kostiense]
MISDTVLTAAISLSLALLSFALLATVIRIVRGPTLPDRVLGLDMLVAIAIGFIAVIAIKTGFGLYIDIAIALGLVGFLATIAFARFVLMRGLAPERAAKAVADTSNLAKRSKTGRPSHRKRKGVR